MSLLFCRAKALSYPLLVAGGASELLVFGGYFLAVKAAAAFSHNRASIGRNKEKMLFFFSSVLPSAQGTLKGKGESHHPTSQLTWKPLPTIPPQILPCVAHSGCGLWDGDALWGQGLRKTDLNPKLWGEVPSLQQRVEVPHLHLLKRR